jgi:NhaA family Na+:H+ antiporter
LILINRLGARDTRLYTLFGLTMWFAFLESGIHATLAGVLVALTIPAYPRMRVIDFVRQGRDMLGEVESNSEKTAALDKKHQELARQLRNSVYAIESPLLRLEHDLHPVSSFIIMPLFALANAGIVLDENLLRILAHPIGIGIVLGLVVGKQVGITTATWLVTRLGVASLPEGVTWRQVYGASWLAGIGFTMALFIASLAFEETALLASAKSGILVASVIAGVVGGAILLVGNKGISNSITSAHRSS